MDEYIQQKAGLANVKKAGIAVAVILVTSLLWNSLSWSSLQSMKVERKDIVTAVVSKGDFVQNIRLRANVDSQHTYYLDVINGGRVEMIYAESGQNVRKGELLVELSNPSVQLSVVRSDAEVTQQLNNINSLELQLQQNKLQHRKNLADIEYNILLLSNKISRHEKLADLQATNEAELEYLKIEIDWYKKQRSIVLESQENDARMQEQQIIQLRQSVKNLKKNLEVSQRSLEGLKIKAPIDGKLGNFDLRIGQSIAQGERVGQIAQPDKLKLVAEIDEFYINQVYVGQDVEVDINNQKFRLEISKIYPEINRNKFKVDINFGEQSQEGIVYGQTIQINLLLNEPEEKLLVSNGSYYQSTGGNWVMVLSPDGSKAVKRKVSLGRRTAENVEVLSGLQKGEAIIISSYEQFTDMDELIIN